MSKIEAGRAELNPSTFNLSQLVESLASMFRFAAQAKALQFDVSVDGEYVAYVVADVGKIRQVLINLLGNAIKFTARGQVKLHITLQRKGPISFGYQPRFRTPVPASRTRNKGSCSSRSIR